MMHALRAGLVVALLGAAVPAGAQGGGARPDSTKADSAARAQSPVTILRELFIYSEHGRRDPMISLMNSADIRPLISEIELIGISYDEDGKNSIAILRQVPDRKQMYRVRVGQQLGRMKVTQITRREVVFTIDDFGMSRQERLSVKPDTSKARTP